MEIEASTFLQAINDYVSVNNLYDCTIIVEGQEFKATKIQLCAISEFFREALSKDSKERKTASNVSACTELIRQSVSSDPMEFKAMQSFIDNDVARQELNSDSRVVINGIKPHIFGKVLKAITTGSLAINEMEMIDIWFACCYLKVPLLSQMCEEYIERNLSKQNYLFLHDNAITIGSKSVCNKLSSLIAEDFERFCTTQAFLNKTSDFILTKVYNIVHSYADFKESSLWAMFNWLNHEPQGEVGEYKFQSYTNIEEVRDTDCPLAANVYTFKREHVVKFVTQHVTLAQDRKAKRNDVITKLKSVLGKISNLSLRQAIDSLKIDTTCNTK